MRFVVADLIRYLLIADMYKQEQERENGMRVGQCRILSGKLRMRVFLSK